MKKSNTSKNIVFDCVKMSSEASLSDVPTVVSRLHNLRLGQEDGDELQQNVNFTISGDSSSEPVRNIQPISNVILSRARRALNFVCDEDQPTSSTARGESSHSNGDK